MIKQLLALFILLLGFSCSSENPSEIKAVTLQSEEIPKPVTFKSKDGLLISGNLYHFSNKVPVILLCHQAGFNKFEYNEIAQKVFESGFNCLSIDQRSGASVGDSINETEKRAVAAGKATGFLDAEQDIEAAITYLNKKYRQKVIVWGSSYSATLALYQGLTNDLVSGVIAFSPGNYFSEQKGDLIAGLSDFHKPLFITSSREEAPSLEKLTHNLPTSNYTVHFTPRGVGQHGSKALWASDNGNQEYWAAVTNFLSGLK